jgi:hypothetical protein
VVHQDTAGLQTPAPRQHAHTVTLHALQVLKQHNALPEGINPDA